jgi:DNA-directed RNA polymerase specialized sigma24 family protein
MLPEFTKIAVASNARPTNRGCIDSSGWAAWELNDLAQRLDEEGLARAPVSCGSGLSLNARRMLEAIEELAGDEREVFSLVRIQGMAQTEVAELLGVAAKTVQRRLNGSLLLLTEKLADLRPTEQPTGEA